MLKYLVSVLFFVMACNSGSIDSKSAGANAETSKIEKSESYVYSDGVYKPLKFGAATGGEAPPNLKDCGNGIFVPQGQECPPKNDWKPCWDGSMVPASGTCPEKPNLNCPDDGVIMKIPCEDGSTASMFIRCPNGETSWSPACPDNGCKDCMKQCGPILVPAGQKCPPPPGPTGGEAPTGTGG